ncbi:MAG: hypothetical protein H6993_09890 [Pseudomonadales bacterium]|nr:hypothetical protein [Pseudomonadales bacterium]
MAGKMLTGLAVVLGITLVANGVYMITAPEPWYWIVPGVPDRGPFNQHFVRDIGFLYLLMGAAFIAGAVYDSYRRQLWLLPALWLVCHALFHIWEVVVGICGPASLVEDFAGVTLPALLAVGLVLGSRGALRDA